jgi:hypothetical protein
MPFGPLLLDWALAFLLLPLDELLELAAFVIPRSKSARFPAVTESGVKKAEKPRALLSLEEKLKPEIPATLVGTFNARPVIAPFLGGVPVVFATLIWSVPDVSLVLV